MKKEVAILVVSCFCIAGCGKETTVGPTANTSPIAGAWQCGGGSLELRASDSVLVFQAGSTLPLVSESRWFMFNDGARLGQILEVNYQGLLLKLAQQPASFLGAKWEEALIRSMSASYEVDWKVDSLQLTSGAFSASCWRPR